MSSGPWLCHGNNKTEIMPNYFSHDSNARNDEKLIRLRIRHKAAGYGVYFMLLEILREKKDFVCLKDYNVIAFELREDAGLIKSVVEDFGLFVFTNREDGEYFYSESLMRRMEKVDGVSAVRRAAANRRWHPEETHQAGGSVTTHEYFADMKRARAWLTDMSLRHHLTLEDIMARIDTFMLDCRCRAKQHTSLQDAQQHFNDWLVIKLQHEKKQPNNNETTKAKRTDRRRPGDVTPTISEAGTGKF